MTTTGENLQQTGAEAQTGYVILPEETLTQLRSAAENHGINPKLVRPDGTIEQEGDVPEDRMRAFLASAGAIRPEGGLDAKRLDDAMINHVQSATKIRQMDTDSGKVLEHTKDDGTTDFSKLDGTAQQAIFAKVAMFLDPKLRGPMTMLEVRHKVFVMRIPVHHEMIDVTQWTGQLAGVPPTEAQAVLSIIGELKKACHGWLPAGAAVALQQLRENVNDPEKWPAMREPDWMSTRDPNVLNSEIFPLWDKYKAWRDSVSPTAEEIDFYYSRLS